MEGEKGDNGSRAQTDDPLKSLSNEDVKESDNESEEPLFDEDVDGKVECSGESKKELDDDLFVAVTSPEKHVQTMETYVSYKVTTQTTRSTFDESEFVVRRRYQDFTWLREKLEEEYPTHILPPLPSKFVMKGVLDRFSNSFIDTRCMALHQFLYRISKHPVISFSEHLKTFLTLKEFAAVRKQGFMSRMSGSLKWSSVNNAEFGDINESMSVFAEKLGVMDRIGERLLQEKKELVGEMREYAPTFTTWGAIEDETIENVMTSVSNCMESCAEEVESNLNYHEKEFIPPLKEYILYTDVVKQTLKRRDIFQSQFEKCDNDLQQKRDELKNLPKSDQSYSIGAMMGKSPEAVREQKEEKLQHQVEELSKRREKLNDELEVANLNFRTEMQRWKENKVKDIANVFSKFAESQITYHNNSLAAWENILPAMRSAETTVYSKQPSV